MISKYLLLTIFFIVTACASPQVPEYVVRLTSPDNRICTGMLFDEHQVYTADHCFKNKLDTVYTQDGRDSGFTFVSRNPVEDVVVLRTTSPLTMTTYAAFAQPDPFRVAYAYGACHHFGLGVAKPVFYQGHIDFPDKPYCTVWVSLVPVCGGDSGGVLVQDGKVVGMIQSVDRVDSNGAAYGYFVCAKVMD